MMSLQDRKWLTLIPPEGIPLRFELARISDRITALLLDLLLVTVTSLVLVLLSLLIVTGGLLGHSLSYTLFGSFFIISLFALRQGYFFFFELKWQGSTPGKRYARLRVIAKDGGSLTLASILARNLFRDLEIFIPISILLASEQLQTMPTWIWLPMLGWVSVMLALPLLNQHHMRLGDMVAGTVVVRIPTALLLEDKAASEEEIRPTLRFSPQQLAIYGEYELETLAEILHKVDEGRAEDKDLALIATTIARKINYIGPEAQSDALSFLRAFYTQQRKQLEAQLLLGQRKASKHTKDDEKST